nr:penicillin acylase family protein [Carbonactinospora thermoautotrophica]
MPSSTLFRRLRIMLIALTGLVLLALIAATSYVVWTVRRSFPQVDGTLSVPGLTTRVEVVRDKWGVPQIYADNALDLFRAQGYVHAQDRFWEMDVRRHVTAGRLSEMFGPSTLKVDKLIRTMGWRKIAEQELERIDPETRRYLQAYAEGVNAYLDEREGAELGLEYTLLAMENGDYRPEPWTPADSLSWLKAMAWDLRANVTQEIDRALLTEKLSVDQIEQLYPPYPYGRHQPILSRGDVRGKRFDPEAPAPLRLPVGVRKQLAELSRELAKIPPLLGPNGTGIGSNSWVVSGALTTTGKPLLANDPHLAPKLPSIWYQMGLHCRKITGQCPFDVAGFTFSGVPGVIIGHNDKIAWGFTNLGADVSDLFLEKVRGDTYEYKGRQVSLEINQEIIKVAGQDDVLLTVRATKHGPLISDVSEEFRKAGAGAPLPESMREPRREYAVALSWTALKPSRTADAIFKLNTARNWTEFRAAAKLFAVPAQNMIYADTQGNIGYQMPGYLPLRNSGDGRWPVPGWVDSYEWKAAPVPFDQLPYALNPKEGYLVTANNAVIPPGYPYLITEDWDYGYRSQRITELLHQRLKENGNKVDAQALRDIQLDNRNPNAELLTPYLLRLRVDPFTREAQELLRHWDYTQPPESAAAAYFNAVWRQTLLLTFGDQMPKEVQPDGGDRWFEVVRGIIDEPDNPWWDDVRTPRRETRDDILRKAMRKARYELTRKLTKDPENWHWGRLHKMWLLNDTLGNSDDWLVKKLLNRGPYEVGGGESLVNATGWDAAKGYTTDWVPSMRMVVDLGNLDASTWINLTGASGHAYHGNYVDQAELWTRGEQLPWPFSEQAVRQAAENTLVLEPGPPLEGAVPG